MPPLPEEDAPLDPDELREPRRPPEDDADCADDAAEDKLVADRPPEDDPADDDAADEDPADEEPAESDPPDAEEARDDPVDPEPKLDEEADAVADDPEADEAPSMPELREDAGPEEEPLLEVAREADCAPPVTAEADTPSPVEPAVDDEDRRAPEGRKHAPTTRAMSRSAQESRPDPMLLAIAMPDHKARPRPRGSSLNLRNDVAWSAHPSPILGDARTGPQGPRQLLPHPLH